MLQRRKPPTSHEQRLARRIVRRAARFVQPRDAIDQRLQVAAIAIQPE